MADIGIVSVEDRSGRPMQVLAWEGGTRSSAEGRDLAAVCRALTLQQLETWLAVLRRSGSMITECGVVQAEIDRRDPCGVCGTLWEFADAAGLCGNG